ncbi:DUF4827 family protein [Parabacteroides faecis]|uniref:DUF4827 family protein n=1 Tax=Parabacteroides TaxID=375288 RepID=UPI000EFF9294|nr:MULTISPECIES: DUF4827 family protein [Parabacteroides]MBC8619315.1 DUF4827 family protein [Parabacteroides faecis]RHR92857.1 DUF4827 family protein [Parabacteroides sp. AF14-59]
MKRGFYILMILCAALMVVSCDKTKSYTEHLKDERKAIERLIKREGFHIIDDYPGNGVFAENEFVKLENGVYMNVVDSGNGERATLGTRVFCRFIAHGVLDSDSTLLVDNLSSQYNGVWGFPTEFLFGSAASSSGFVNYAPDYFVGEGLVTPMYHVGNGAIVRLIVPFKRMGSTFQDTYSPIYFSKVKYTFEK